MSAIEDCLYFSLLICTLFSYIDRNKRPIQISGRRIEIHLIQRNFTWFCSFKSSGTHLLLAVLCVRTCLSSLRVYSRSWETDVPDWFSFLSSTAGIKNFLKGDSDLGWESIPDGNPTRNDNARIQAFRSSYIPYEYPPINTDQDMDALFRY